MPTFIPTLPDGITPIVDQTGITKVSGALTQGGVLSTAFQTGLAAYSAYPAAVTNAQSVRQIGTLLGVAIIKPYSIPEADWFAVAPVSGIVNTTVAVTFVAAGAAGVKNYLTHLSLSWDALGVVTEVVVRNGASGPVLWRGKLPTAAGYRDIPFVTPLQSSVATLLEFATLTASVTGGVYANAQGYAAAD